MLRNLERRSRGQGNRDRTSFSLTSATRSNYEMRKLFSLSSLAVVSAMRLHPTMTMVAAAAPATRQLLDELDLRCCRGRLEEHPDLQMPWLVMKARPAKIEEIELQSMCDMLRVALDRREKFTVLWDLRQMRPPSRAALRFSIDWMGKPENTMDIDELVSKTIIIARSPIIRGVCTWILKVCDPPRPVRICADDAAALAAARALELEDCSR